jgi:hypothetical protein
MKESLLVVTTLSLLATVLGGGVAKRYGSALETRGASHEPRDIQATSRSEPPLLHHGDAPRLAFALHETLLAWEHAGQSKVTQRVDMHPCTPGQLKTY